MNRINPYRRNCEVMRKFFAKPIFLIIGIVLLIFNLMQIIISVISSKYAFNFLSATLCIAFFMFYFAARSKKESVSFKVPTVLMDVVSIVGIVFSGLIFIFSGIMTVLFMLPTMLPTKSAVIEYHGSYEFLWSTLGKALYYMAVILFPIVAVLSLLLLFYFIGMQRMCLSFKKSLSNIYLQRKGSVMFGVMSIIFAVLSAGATVACFTSFKHSLNILANIECANATVIFICMAILGFSYNSYIKKLVNTIETGKPVQETTNNTEKVTESNPTLDMWAESETFNQPLRQATVTRPVEFTPQAVFGGNKAVESETKPSRVQIPENDMQNPYVRNSALPTKRCANCGKENPNINIFCGNCGNRL